MTDRPLTLAEAAKHYSLTKGVLKADGLRGRLAIYRLGKTYYTTHSAVREWVESCRVVPKGRASISIERGANGKSAMDRIISGPNLLVRTEWIHYNLGATSHPAPGDLTVTSHNSGDLARVGLAYKF